MQASSTALAALATVGMWWHATADADGAFKTLDFPTTGGIQARADLYEPTGRSEALILLFHQAGWSRGEYREIAPKLVQSGYRVMAVDQRSGGAVNGVANETAKRAEKKDQPRDYLDAYADLEAALAHARKALKAERVIVWGSSYSASLVFRLAAEHPREVTAVIAFSPGEYFKKEGPTYVESLAKRVTQPVFVTSSKDEREQVKPIFDAAPTKRKILFTPASKGRHGSRALWLQSPDHEVYWAAVNEFLEEHAPARAPD
jgi:pimeloyl-ACP methyl ester carboxylesterase